LISIVASDNPSQSEASALPIAVNQNPDAHSQPGPFSGYDSFKSHYLNLSPDVADSAAFLETLIHHQAFDWLNQLVEETLGDEPVEQARHEPLEQPVQVKVKVPVHTQNRVNDADAQAA